jgi:SAM-dependent methyltransferase
MELRAQVKHFYEIEVCRLCGGGLFQENLYLRSTGLANELYSEKSTALLAEKFPLELAMCKDCRHIQLKHIVNADRLFENYVYQSGTSKTFQNHFAALSAKIKTLIDGSGYVLEIGSNDGTLLNEMNKIGIRSVGIEPSHSLVHQCEELDLEVIEGFLDESTVIKIVENYGKPSVVVGNNVFAHIDQISKAFSLVSSILDEGGIFIFEVAHALSLFDNKLFDSIYHEHMSYHSVYSLKEFFNKIGMTLTNVEKIPTHGGSIRVFVKNGLNQKSDPIVDELIDLEIFSGLNSPEIFKVLRSQIDELRIEIHSSLRKFGENVFLFGYGAPAKVVTFLSEMELEKLPIQGIIDDNKNKQGKFLPVSGIPIISSLDLELEISHQELPSLCLIFPWNLGKELEGKLAEFIPPGSSAITFFPSVRLVKF